MLEEADTVEQQLLRVDAVARQEQGGHVSRVKGTSFRANG